MQRSHRRSVALTLCTASAISLGCTAETDAIDQSESDLISRTASTETATATDVSGVTTSTRLARGDLFDTKPPTVVGLAPDPTFPQKKLNVIGRTVTPRVPAKTGVPAVPGSATFKLSWESTGSPSQILIYRQAWVLGATNTKEFSAGPVTQIASLGALPNGYQTFTDPAPVLNTRNCYYVKAGDGAYFSYSNWACADAPDPEHPHPIGKVQIRLKLSTASSAVTSSNVRVRLNYGIPGSTGPVYTWLDSVDTPFYTPGGEQIFTLRTPGISDLSDITMIRVEVPGDDGLCLSKLELVVDDTVAFRKTSSTQGCGNGNPFEWAWHSGKIEGTTVEIPFQELRNSSLWKSFNPFIYLGTVTEDRPYGSSFVGYTPAEFRRKLDSITAHNLKDDGSDTGSSVRRFRNGSSDVTSVTWVDERTVRVQQHVRLADSSGCTVDAHPVFNLKIRPLNANNEPFDGTNGPIAATEIVSQLLSEGIDQGGWCQWVPGVGAYIQFKASVDFGKEFRAAGATSTGKPPAGMRFCFPKAGLARPWTDFDNGGLSLCFGEQ